MVGRRWFGSKPGTCACKRARRKSPSPYWFAWQNLLVNYFRCQGCVTFWIRGLQVSLTKTKDKVCWSGLLNL